MACCGKSPRHGKDVTKSSKSGTDITMDFAGEECLNFNDKCPLDRSGLRLVRRPIDNWRCKANGHRWRVC